jgi:hypothetical protein
VSVVLLLLLLLLLLVLVVVVVVLVTSGGGGGRWRSLAAVAAVAWVGGEVSGDNLMLGGSSFGFGGCV